MSNVSRDTQPEEFYDCIFEHPSHQMSVGGNRMIQNYVESNFVLSEAIQFILQIEKIDNSVDIIQTNCMLKLRQNSVFYFS